LVELGVVIGLALWIVLQMILLAIRNEPLFPMFRKKSERQEREEAFAELNKRVTRIEEWKAEKQALEDRISELEAKEKN